MACFAASALLAGTVGAAGAGGADERGLRFTEEELRRVLSMAPLPELPRDPSNAVADDPRAARLGEQLFFDERLSFDGERSCASCHQPALDWTDGRRASDPGARFPRNAPSLWNTAYSRWFFWDGRADSAWAQALGPLEQEGELGSNRLRLLHVVRGDAELRRAYVEVFAPLPDGVEDPRRFPPDARPVPKSPEHPLQLAWASMSEGDRHQANVVFTNLGKAIAAFERTLVVEETALDRFVAKLRGSDVSSARPELSEAAVRGLRLFVGPGQCTLCHSGPLLSDGEFHDLGIALTAGHRIDPARHRGVLEILQSPFTRGGPYADAPSPGAPIHYLDQRTHQLGQFKTPSLRGVADTAPYMHDGRFATLEDVVRFYDTRQGAAPLGHPTTLLQPLGLSEQDVADLVAFLESLTREGAGREARVGPESPRRAARSSTARPTTTRRLDGRGFHRSRPRAPDHEPEDDRHFRDLQRQGDLPDQRRVPRHDQGGEGARQIGDPRHHQQVAEHAGDEARADDQQPEWEEPEPPEDGGHGDSLAVEAEEEVGEGVELGRCWQTRGSAWRASFARL